MSWLDDLMAQIAQNGADAVPSEPATDSNFSPSRDSQQASSLFGDLFEGGRPSTESTPPARYGDISPDYTTAAADSQRANADLGLAPRGSESSSPSVLSSVSKALGLQRDSSGNIDYSNPKTIDTIMKLVMAGGALMQHSSTPQGFKTAAQLRAEIQGPSNNWTPQQQASANAFFGHTPLGSNHPLQFASSMPSPITPGRGYADGGSVAMPVTQFSPLSASYSAYGTPGTAPQTPSGTQNWLPTAGTPPVQTSPPPLTATDPGAPPPNQLPPTSPPPGWQGGQGGPGMAQRDPQFFINHPDFLANQQARAAQQQQRMQADAARQAAQQAAITPQMQAQMDANKQQDMQRLIAKIGLMTSDPGTLPQDIAHSQAQFAMRFPGQPIPTPTGTFLPAGSIVPPHPPKADRVPRHFAAGGQVPMGGGFPQMMPPVASGSGGAQNWFPPLPPAGGPLSTVDPGRMPPQFNPAGGTQFHSSSMLNPRGMVRGSGGGSASAVPAGAYWGDPPGQAMPPPVTGALPGLSSPPQYPGVQMQGVTPAMPGSLTPPAQPGMQATVGALPGMSSPPGVPGTQMQGTVGPLPGLSAPPQNPGTQMQGFARGGRMPGYAKGGALGHVMAMTGGQDDVVPATLPNGKPAALAGGEYVMDADAVSALGDGNNAAGAKKLDTFRENLRAHKRSAPKSKIPPKAKPIDHYMRGGRG